MEKHFNKDYLIDELDLPYAAIQDDIVGTGRWDVFHEIVFQDLDGTYWKTCYSEGATEMQPEGPWEYDKEVECYQVKPAVRPINTFVLIDDNDKRSIKIPDSEQAAIKEYLRNIPQNFAMELYELLSMRVGDDRK